MPNVAYKRLELVNLLPRYTLIADCISGDKAIKDKKTTYLPQPNPADTSQENALRYQDYLCRAVFYGVTSRTLRGLQGQIFSRDPVLMLPDSMAVLEEDVDGGGVSLNQQARKALGFVIAYGRCGILCDYPITDKPASVADLAAGNIRPTITLYDPAEIINWRVATINGKKLLTLIVLSHKDVINDDGFEQEYEIYYRVLRLKGYNSDGTGDGTYVSEIWHFDEGKNEYVLDTTTTPVDSKGKPWKEIPFTFIGSENNDSHPDLPPLYDMAVLNVAHYRNSADYEEACYLMGQPTPYFSGLSEQWVKDVLKGTIQLGSRAAVALPEQGSAGILQVGENTMPKEAMDHKERQMVALGAKLVEQQTVQRTATEANQEEASTTSLLATCAKNVSCAYTCALKWAGMFLGTYTEDAAPSEDGTDSIDYELNTEFDSEGINGVDAQALIAAWQANAITFEEMRDRLKHGGWAYLDDDEAKAQMDTAGVDLGMPVGSPASAAQAAADAAAKAKADAGKNGPPTSGKPGKNTPPAN